MNKEIQKDFRELLDMIKQEITSNDYDINTDFVKNYNRLEESYNKYFNKQILPSPYRLFVVGEPLKQL